MDDVKEARSVSSGNEDTNPTSASATQQTPLNLENLSPKLQQDILHHLDFHTLLICRLLSKNLKSQVDSFAATQSTLTVDRNLTWNPYYTIRRYFDLEARNILGLVRLENAAAVQKFVEENGTTKLAKPQTGSGPSTANVSKPWARSASAERKTTPTASTRTSITPTRHSSKTSKTASTRPPFRPAGSASPKNLTTTPVTKSKIQAKPPSKPDSRIFPSKNNQLFPLGSVHIRRRLQDYVEQDKKDSHPPADTNKEIIQWTNRLVQDFGPQLTSFTFDDGKRKGSDLSFAQLRFFLKHLPNLVFLGISSGNYEHYSFDRNTGEYGEVERFSPHANLKYVWLGYNTTYHLHMDILNAFGSQLKRLTNSKFGIFLQSSFGDVISTSNSLQKMLDYVNGLRNTYPNMLSSLEELKAPILSTQNLMHEIEVSADNPIRWSNLKRLSLFYLYRPGSPKVCDFADVFSFLNVLAPTLEDLCLDFESCADFIGWLSEEDSPLTKDVYQPCPKLKTLSISAISLLRFMHLSKMIYSKFPGLKQLTFFNWWLYHGECNHNGFEGKCFSGGPKTVGEVGLCMTPFWMQIPSLDRASIMIGTWDTECVYRENRKTAGVPF